MPRLCLCLASAVVCLVANTSHAQAPPPPGVGEIYELTAKLQANTLDDGHHINLDGYFHANLPGVGGDTQGFVALEGVASANLTIDSIAQASFSKTIWAESFEAKLFVWNLGFSSVLDGPFTIDPPHDGDDHSDFTALNSTARQEGDGAYKLTWRYLYSVAGQPNSKVQVQYYDGEEWVNHSVSNEDLNGTAGIRSCIVEVQPQGPHVQAELVGPDLFRFAEFRLAFIDENGDSTPIWGTYQFVEWITENALNANPPLITSVDEYDTDPFDTSGGSTVP